MTERKPIAFKWLLIWIAAKASEAFFGWVAGEAEKHIVEGDDPKKELK